MWWVAITDILPWKGLDGSVLGFTVTFAFPIAFRSGVWIRVYRSRVTYDFHRLTNLNMFAEDLVQRIKDYIRAEGYPRARPGPTSSHLLYQLKGAGFDMIKEMADDHNLTLGRMPDVAA